MFKYGVSLLFLSGALALAQTAAPAASSGSTGAAVAAPTDTGLSTSYMSQSPDAANALVPQAGDALKDSSTSQDSKRLAKDSKDAKDKDPNKMTEDKDKDKEKDKDKDKDKEKEKDKDAARKDAPEIIRSDFEKFAAEALGSFQPVFGRPLFSQPTSTFVPLDQIPVPSDYVLGPGDSVKVQIWGMIEFQATLAIDRNGQANIPRVGVVTLAGLRYSQLAPFLRESIGKVYKNFELNVSMGQLRSIQVFLLGQVRQPGTYTVSSLSTLFNALMASGGPTGNGTMRHIQLLRNNKLFTEFDVYDMQMRGDKSRDVALLPGDVIFVPHVGEQIAVIGNVNDPGIYELSGKTTVADFLKGAGGLTSIATTDIAILERIDENHHRLVEQFPLTGDSLLRTVRGGDILRIFPISPKFDKTVTLRGNVAAPGRFPWRSGMHVSDLLPNRSMLIPRTYWTSQNRVAGTTGTDVVGIANEQTTETNWDYASIQRLDPRDLTYKLVPFNLGKAIDDPTSQENRELLEGDVISIYTRKIEPPHDGFVVLRGNVARPGRFPWHNGMRVADMIPNRDALITPEHWEAENGQAKNSRPDVLNSIMQNSVEINWEYAAIERLNKSDLTTTLLSFRLGKAIDEVNSQDNLQLQPGDIITIFSQRDLPLPIERHQIFVRVGGEVKAPGVYRVNPGDTLRDVLRQAGGLTSKSYLFGSVLTRLSAQKAQQSQLEDSIARMRKDLVSSYASHPQNNSTNDSQGKSAALTQMTVEQQLIDSLAQVKMQGRIVLGLKPDTKQIDELPAMTLEDGDTVTIPNVMSSIQVVGAVYNANSFRYQPKRTVGDYIRNAGGLTRNADKDHIYIIRADGTTANRNNKTFWAKSFSQMPLQPGDAVVAPVQIKVPSTFWQNLSPIAQILTSAATTGALMAAYM